MADELDKIIADAGKAKAAQASGEKTPEQKKADEDTKKREEHLANINKAIEEANNKLRETREAARKVGATSEEEELPKIDLNDPNSKAWEKHFNGKVDPLKGELEKEKDEVRTFALRRFLQGKPNLAKDPDGIKRVMDTYNKIKTASERTQEGVLMDLEKSYAAEFHQEILNSRRQNEIDVATGETIFSEPGVSYGSTSYKTEAEKNPHLSKDDEIILAKWGMSPTEWVKMKKDQEKKS